MSSWYKLTSIVDPLWIWLTNTSLLNHNLFFLVYPNNCSLSTSQYKALSFLFVCFCFFQDRVSLCSSGCPATHSVDQAGLHLRNPPASASQKLVFLKTSGQKLVSSYLGKVRTAETDCILGVPKCCIVFTKENWVALAGYHGWGWAMWWIST